MSLHHIYDSNAQVEPLADNLWSVSNCFGPETFERLSRAHTSYEDTWHRHSDCLEYRLQLAPQSPTLLAMTEIGNAMLPQIEQITGVELARAECKLWLDLSGWHCPYHYDDPMLVVTYQVFLWQHGDVHGTEFVYGPEVPKDQWHNHKLFENHTKVATKFTPNTGYINRNTDLKIHYCPNISGTRLSAAWQFRRKV